MNEIPKIKIFGQEILKIGIGTWGIGGYMQKNIYSDYINEISQIKFQLSKGIQLIDCWIPQGGGSSIDLIRQAIADFPRDKYILLCKFDTHKYRNTEELEKIFNAYLSQLGVSYIDVFQLHTAEIKNISESEIEEFYLKKFKEGKVRHFAVSNANTEDLELLQSRMKIKVEANEILYNIFDRKYGLDGTTQYCTKNNIPIIAYRPLNRGMTNILSQDQKIASVVSGTGLTPNQMALQWLLRKENTMALVKSSNRAHINENLDCFNAELSDKQIDVINEWKMEQTT